MKGIITFYLNTHLGVGRSTTEEVELFIKVNQNLFEKLNPVLKGPDPQKH